MSNRDGNLTVSDIKRVNRQLRKAKGKLARKVESLRKLREESYNMGREIGFLNDDLRNLLNPMYQPPATNYNDR